MAKPMMNSSKPTNPPPLVSNSANKRSPNNPFNGKYCKKVSLSMPLPLERSANSCQVLCNSDTSSLSKRLAANFAFPSNFTVLPADENKDENILFQDEKQESRLQNLLMLWLLTLRHHAILMILNKLARNNPINVQFFVFFSEPLG